MKRKQYNLLFNRYGSLYIETALTWDSLEEAERFMEQRYDYEFTKHDTQKPYAIVEVDVVIVKYLTNNRLGCVFEPLAYGLGFSPRF